MKHFLITLLLISMLLFMAFSCEKSEGSAYQKADGLILDYGDPAVDGCGWMIKIDDTIYSPLILDSEFYKDSLNVILSYRILDSIWNCGWRIPGYKLIEIDKIDEY